MNNKILSLSVVFLVPLFFKLYPQEKIDDALFRAIYEFTFKTDELQPDFHRTDLMYLEIGSNVSKFYSYNHYRRDSITNDGLSKNLSVYDINELRKSYKKGTTAVYYQDRKVEKVFVADNWVFYHAYYEEPILLPKWKITGKIKKIAGYECIEAATNYLGRNWMVYFTREIPINQGPWKLWGLPGLIIQAIDTDNFFRYELKSFEKLSKKVPIIFVKETHAHKPYVKKSKEEFRKIEKIYYSDTKFFMENYLEMKGGIATDSDGAVITRKLTIPHIPLEPW